MKAATITLEEILKGFKGKNKKTPLKGYYCQDDDTVTTCMTDDSSKDKFYSTIEGPSLQSGGHLVARPLRDPQGRLHKLCTNKRKQTLRGDLYPQPNGATATRMCNTQDRNSTR
jgi:hypothetical protein